MSRRAEIARVRRRRNERLDERILAELRGAGGRWRRASEIAGPITWGRVDPIRTDGQEVGARLRSLRSRGLVESRRPWEAPELEWRIPPRD